jgi:WD40 repeat protein
VSADRKYALTGNQNGSVSYWDVVGLKQLHRFEGKHSPASMVCVGLSADGRLGISGGSDKVVCLWGFPRPPR